MKITTAIVFGGRSVENEISVLSALQVINAIDTQKYTVVPVYISKDGRWFSGDALLEVDNFRNLDVLYPKCKEVFFSPTFGDFNLYFKKPTLFGKKSLALIDVVLPVLHGTNGEDGSFQGLMELIGIPYAGCNILSSANGMDKVTMKQILSCSGIAVVDYCHFTDKQWLYEQSAQVSAVETKLGYPVIVKPANLGSSVGISVAKDRAALIESVEQATQYSTRIIVEKLVQDLIEINCSVLGDYYNVQTSVCEKPLRSGSFLSYTDKYAGGSSAKGNGAKNSTPTTSGSKGMASTKREIPAILPQEQTDAIKQMAADTFKALYCSGVSRIDFMIDGATNEIFVNEINTIPGSLSYYLWSESGVNFPTLLDEILRLALMRSQENSFKITSYQQNILSLKGKGAKN